METTTIRQIKAGYTSADKLRVYVIEGEGCVLYVGKSKDAIIRVESHLGLGQWRGFFGGNTVDNILVSNPKADDYTVTFYSEQDIEQMDPGNYMDSQVSVVEGNLIYELSPVFNSNGNKKHSENSDRWDTLYPPKAMARLF